MNRAPSKESEEEETLPLGEESRLGGETPGEPPREPVLRGAASIPSVGVEPKSTALPQAGQKRAAPGTSLPQAGQLMTVAGVYHRPLPSFASAERSLRKNGVQPAGKVPRCYPGPFFLLSQLPVTTLYVQESRGVLWVNGAAVSCALRRTRVGSAPQGVTIATLFDARTFLQPPRNHYICEWLWFCHPNQQFLHWGDGDAEIM
jgi:hypothetical protein